MQVAHSKGGSKGRCAGIVPITSHTSPVTAPLPLPLPLPPPHNPTLWAPAVPACLPTHPVGRLPPPPNLPLITDHPLDHPLVSSTIISRHQSGSGLLCLSHSILLPLCRTISPLNPILNPPSSILNPQP